MAFLLSAFHILVIFSIAFLFQRRETFLKALFWPCLILKLSAGIILGLLYTYYFPVGDTFSYFKDATVLASVAKVDFPGYVNILFFNSGVESLTLNYYEPRALFLTKITSVFNLITLDNYWIISLYFSLISFFGAWHLVKIINRKISAVTLPSVIAFLLWPSLVLWSSGLIKEALAIAAMYYLTVIFIQIWFNERPSIPGIMIALLSLWIFWNLKYYFAAVFLPVMVTTIIYKWMNRSGFVRSATIETLAWFGIFILPVIVISLVHPNLNAGRLLDVIALNNASYNELSAAENVVHFRNLQPTIGSLIQNAPWAFFSGMFRPLFWEANNLAQLMAGIENTLLLLLFLAACFQVKQYRTSPHRVMVLAAMVYISALCVFITLSAPNFGTLSRYRTGYLSFFVFLILCNNPLLIYLQRSIRRLVSH